MRLYLIRHAESELNAAKVHQHRDTPLHERGVLQIETAGRRLSSVGIDAILASPYERAKVTAEGIGRHLPNLPIEFVDDLREIRRPSEMQGKTTTDPEVLKIQSAIVAHYSNPDFAYSDEETFNDLKARAMRVLDHARSLGKQKVLAVTHAASSRVLIACAMFGPDLAPREYQGLWGTVIDNIGITILEHDIAHMSTHPWGNPWKLLALNTTGEIT
jgi:broad specificity phosphatase PhoE